MATAAPRFEGALTTWNAQRGFGFITPTSGGRDVFVHITAFLSRASPPQVGEMLSYEIVRTADGKTRAAVVARSDAPAPVRRVAKRGSGRRHPLVFVPVVAVGVFIAYLVVERELPLWVVGVYGGASLIAFVTYAADKAAARGGGWRTSESTLLLIGMVGGWPGAVVAQHVLRHKTRKASFQAAFWATVAVNVAVLVALGWGWGR